MSRKLTHVLNPHSPLLRGGGTAYAAADDDALACWTPVEGTEDQSRGLRVGAGEGVEAGPVDVVGGWGQGFVGVPEEGGGVG